MENKQTPSSPIKTQKKLFIYLQRIKVLVSVYIVVCQFKLFMFQSFQDTQKEIVQRFSL